MQLLSIVALAQVLCGLSAISCSLLPRRIPVTRQSWRISNVSLRNISAMRQVSLGDGFKDLGDVFKTINDVTFRSQTNVPAAHEFRQIGIWLRETVRNHPHVYTIFDQVLSRLADGSNPVEFELCRKEFSQKAPNNSVHSSTINAILDSPNILRACFSQYRLEEMPIRMRPLDLLYRAVDQHGNCIFVRIVKPDVEETLYQMSKFVAEMRTRYEGTQSEFMQLLLAQMPETIKEIYQKLGAAPSSRGKDENVIEYMVPSVVIVGSPEGDKEDI